MIAAMDTRQEVQLTLAQLRALANSKRLAAGDAERVHHNHQAAVTLERMARQIGEAADAIEAEARAEGLLS